MSSFNKFKSSQYSCLLVLPSRREEQIESYLFSTHIDIIKENRRSNQSSARFLIKCLLMGRRNLVNQPEPPYGLENQVIWALAAIIGKLAPALIF